MGVEMTLLDGVARVTLCWPERSNALGPTEADELRDCLEQTGTGGARAIVLCSTGRSFCAGGDLPAILDLVSKGEDAVRERIYGSFQGLFRGIRNSPIPIIAAVDGPAVGLGCDLALACGLTFVGAAGWFRQGWAALGLIPATGGAEYVRRRGGTAAVWQMLASSRIDGPAAEKLQIAVSVPIAEEAAHAVAQNLAAVPHGVLEAMQVLVRADERQFEQHLAVALDFQVGFLLSEAFGQRAKAAVAPR
jgi:enoyl-CoA hydratase/carnithine racemase